MDINEKITTGRLTALLVRLAKSQEALAAAEAADTPYWAPYPESVVGHRVAAAVLREEAERLASTGAAA